MSTKWGWLDGLAAIKFQGAMASPSACAHRRRVSHEGGEPFDVLDVYSGERRRPAGVPQPNSPAAYDRELTSRACTGPCSARRFERSIAGSNRARPALARPSNSETTIADTPNATGSHSLMESLLM